MRDVVILGGGPAGISAGIYVRRSGFEPLVIDNGTSALSRAKVIDNYYGIEHISGDELVRRGIEQYKNLGGEYMKAEVTSIRANFEDGTYELEVGGKPIGAKALILALGKGQKKVHPLLKEFESTNVSYCAVCDGFFYAGKDVAVVGDGAFALSEANELAKNAKTVYLLGKLSIKNPKLSKNIIVKAENPVAFSGKGQVDEVLLEGGEKLKLDGVFVALGTLSNFEIAKQLGIITKNDTIVVDRNFMTNLAGVFAAGDCIGGLLQVSKAVGDGAQAGIEAVRYLVLKYGDKEEQNKQKAGI